MQGGGRPPRIPAHGTTTEFPREVFGADEQAKLQPDDGVIRDVPLWNEVAVHPDHHVSFGQPSTPPRLSPIRRERSSQSAVTEGS